MTRLSTKARRELYKSALAEAAEDGLEHPPCNICDLPIFPTDAWDESHMPVAKAFGGSRTGIAHRLCNRRHGSKVVTPAVAQAKRRYDRAHGIHRPRKPMPCGRDSAFRKKITGEVVRR